MAKAYKRHIAKSFTWRVIGTVDTVILAWLISGNPYTGLQIGFAEVVTKMFLYYIHERIWFKFRSGVLDEDSKTRHLMKTFTWRLVGTLDTMVLAWAISGNPMIGLKVGGAEVITKMILYYFHERVWYNIDFGLRSRSQFRHEGQSIKK